MARIGDVQLQRTFECTWSNPGSFPRCFREVASCLCFNNANNKAPMVLTAISSLSQPPNKQLVSGQAGSILVLLTPSPVFFALGPSQGRTGIRPGLKSPSVEDAWPGGKLSSRSPQRSPGPSSWGGGSPSTPGRPAPKPVPPRSTTRAPRPDPSANTHYTEVRAVLWISILK